MRGEFGNFLFMFHFMTLCRIKVNKHIPGLSFHRQTSRQAWNGISAFSTLGDKIFRHVGNTWWLPKKRNFEFDMIAALCIVCTYWCASRHWNQKLQLSLHRMSYTLEIQGLLTCYGYLTVSSLSLCWCRCRLKVKEDLADHKPKIRIR